MNYPDGMCHNNELYCAHISAATSTLNEHSTFQTDNESEGLMQSVILHADCMWELQKAV